MRDIDDLTGTVWNEIYSGTPEADDGDPMTLDMIRGEVPFMEEKWTFVRMVLMNIPIDVLDDLRVLQELKNGNSTVTLANDAENPRKH